MFEVNVIEYVRPNGLRKLHVVELPLELKPLYDNIVEHGCHFEAEYIGPMWHITISNGTQDVVGSFEIRVNATAWCKLLNNFTPDLISEELS